MRLRFRGECGLGQSGEKCLCFPPSAGKAGDELRFCKKEEGAVK